MDIMSLSETIQALEHRRNGALLSGADRLYGSAIQYLKEIEWREKVVELAQRTEQKAAAEINLLSACVYYKRGGLCRYEGDDPANMCVMGPCPHEKSAEEVLADLARVTAERDALIKRTAGDCWSCIRRYECNSRKGPHRRCWEFDPWLLKED